MADLNSQRQSQPTSQNQSPQPTNNDPQISGLAQSDTEQVNFEAAQTLCDQAARNAQELLRSQQQTYPLFTQQTYEQYANQACAERTLPSNPLKRPTTLDFTKIRQTVQLPLLESYSEDSVLSPSKSLASAMDVNPLAPELQEIRVRPNIVFSHTFSGTTEENAADFLKRFNIVANLNGWSEPIRKQQFQVALTGVALKWHTDYWAEHSNATWGQLEKHFRNAFPHFNRCKLERELVNREQGKNEDLNSYYYNMKDLCRKFDPNMKDSEIVRRITTGMRQPYNNLIRIQRPSTTEELRVYVQALVASEAEDMDKYGRQKQSSLPAAFEAKHAAKKEQYQQARERIIGEREEEWPLECDHAPGVAQAFTPRSLQSSISRLEKESRKQKEQSEKMIENLRRELASLRIEKKTNFGYRREGERYNRYERDGTAARPLQHIDDRRYGTIDRGVVRYDSRDAPRVRFTDDNRAAWPRRNFNSEHERIRNQNRESENRTRRPIYDGSVTCYFCQKPGHYASSCPAKQANATANNNPNAEEPKN